LVWPVTVRLPLIEAADVGTVTPSPIVKVCGLPARNFAGIPPGWPVPKRESIRRVGVTG